MITIFTIAPFFYILTPFNPSKLWIWSRIIALPLAKLWGIKLELDNMDKIKSDLPAVFISNHQENLDIIPAMAIVPPNTVSIGKRSLLYIPFFGLFYWLSGNILINRNNKRDALNSLKIATNNIVQKQISIWLFPEGTRSRGKGIKNFKKGAFHIAINAQVPIIPIVISSYQNLNFKKFKTGTIKVKIVNPIKTKGLTRQDVDILRDQCHHLMVKTYGQI